MAHLEKTARTNAENRPEINLFNLTKYAAGCNDL